MKLFSASSLVSRINAATLLVIVVGMVIGALGVSWLSYQRTLNALNKKAWDTLRTAELALNEAVWNRQQRQIKAVVNAFMTDPDFMALIVENQDQVLFAQQRNAAQGLDHQELIHSAAQHNWIHLHTTLGRAGKVEGRVHLVVTRENATRQFWDSLQQLFVAAIGILLLTVLAQWFIIRHLVKRPVSTLIHSAQDLAAGNLNAPIDLHREDELGVLAQSFESMRVAIKSQIDDLRLLNETAETLASKISQHETLDTVVRVVQQHLPVERCSVYQYDPEQNQLFLSDSFPDLPPPQPPPRTFQLGEGAVGQCAQSKTLLLIPDTSACEYFVGEGTPRFLIVVPLLDQQRLIGVMNFSGSVTAQPLNPHLHDFTSTLARITVANLKNLEMRTVIQQQNEHLRATLNVFEKFVPLQFQHRVAEEGVHNIRIGQANSDFISILFSDIRSFTSLSEQMEPQRLLNFVNAYLERVCAPLGQHYGFVDKFIGDAVMALFDMPERSDYFEALCAVRSAIAMHAARRAFNAEWQPRGFPALVAGVGIHSGPVVIGTMGTSLRIETTVLGDSVNLASRLEMLTKYFDARVLASGTTRSLVRKEPFHWRPLGTYQVKGHQQPIEVHELLDADHPDRSMRKQETLERFQEGLGFFQQRQWPRAQATFQECLRHLPEDGAAQFFRQLCQEWEVHPPPDDWKGVITLLDK